ncbi:asparagine-linked glycosylation protein [Coemansia sp. Cherry 401B]|nr:asparagine-linked glycosylation protein [Coemansia sp. RSA 2610]KAJ2730556.1 asparagine-linked glycosylation protein [Coemansia sp. Cherry 401B]
MPSLETLIHYGFLAGLALAVPMLFTLGVRVLVLGTQAHQDSARSAAAAATHPDTSNHPVYYAGFFHPYPNAGGGGERVLWTMIKAIQDKYPFVVCVVYSGDRIARDDLVRSVQSKFGLAIRAESLYVVDLQWRSWVDHKYPRLTLLLQSIGSILLAAEAVHRFAPDMFIDTVGYAFTYPLVAMLSARMPIISYTHYPTISSDMQTMVSSRESGFNNDPRIARSPALSNLKSAYYLAMAHAYAFAGSFASIVMTNSSWTHDHIVKLFDMPRMTKVVYPPCDTTALARFPLDNRRNIVMSLAQFRPEKNHRLQIEAFAKFLDEHPQHKAPPAAAKPALADILSSDPEFPQLVMLGGARNLDDEARAESLRQLAKSLGIERQVHVVVNAPWSQVLKWLERSSLGIHTMRDEHFGINIVEMMAAGLLTIAHDSAGPKLDIITPAIHAVNGEVAAPSERDASAYLAAQEQGEAAEFPVGMVATTADEFAQMIAFGLGVAGPVEQALRTAARAAATTKFSEAAFCTAFYRRFGPVVRWLDIQNSDNDEE